MPVLYIADKNETITDFKSVQNILKVHGVALEQWNATTMLSERSTQDEILAAYAHELKPFMSKNGYQAADVINVHPLTENIQVIREKFMKEHTHSDDEVRFFVGGEGKFWFNLDSGEVLCVTCVAGDFISVPKNFKHWFDLHPKYNVKAIRIFTNTDGWLPVYTNSGIDSKYNP